jgi:hypothetical protein
LSLLNVGETRSGIHDGLPLPLALACEVGLMLSFKASYGCLCIQQPPFASALFASQDPPLTSQRLDIPGRWAFGSEQASP